MRRWEAKGLSVFQGPVRVARAFPVPDVESGHVTARIMAEAEEMRYLLDFLYHDVRLSISPMMNDRIRETLERTRDRGQENSD